MTSEGLAVTETFTGSHLGVAFTSQAVASHHRSCRHSLECNRRQFSELAILAHIGIKVDNPAAVFRDEEDAHVRQTEVVLRLVDLVPAGLQIITSTFEKRTSIHREELDRFPMDLHIFETSFLSVSELQSVAARRPTNDLRHSVVVLVLGVRDLGLISISKPYGKANRDGAVYQADFRNCFDTH